MNIIKPIYAYKWVSSKEYIKYVFDTDENNSYDASIKVIKEYIYQDSSKEDAINKIAYYINKNSKNSDDKIPYYVWVNNKPFLYEYVLETIRWKGYDVNPFKSSDRKSEEINAIKKIDNKSKELFNTNDIINIVFKNDFDYDNKYYYDNFKFKSNNYKLNSDSKITELYKLNILNNKKTSEEYNDVIFSEYIANLPSLIVIFDMISATNKIQLIQYINNNINKTYYKLYKKHTFNRKELSRISKEDNKGSESINIYYNKTDIVITIYADGIINLKFKYQIDNGVIINDILKYKDELNKYINDVLNINIEFKEQYINARIKYNIDKAKYSDLKNELKISTIFTELDAEVFYYKRTSNYIDRSIIDKNVKNNIQNNNIKLNTIDYADVLDTHIIVNKKNGQYMFDIKYAKSFFEFESLKFWISKIIEITINNNNNKQSSIDSPDSSDSPLTSGGIGNENDRYLINKLKDADKEYWKKDKGIKNKAKGCQKKFQPIPLSNEEFVNFEKNGLNKHFDNFIKYNNYYYICPRLWCPKSNVPLPFTEEGNANAKCPIADEKPLRLNEDMKNKNLPRYAYYTKHNIPCCGKKNTDKKNNIDKDSNSIIQINPKQENIDKKGNNYIMKDYPINYNNRFGDIPKELYKILYPTNYSDYLKVCSSPSNINKKECILRKGLINIDEIRNKYDNKYDNIINVVAYLVGKKREAFIEDIKNKIDVITYLSMDNGNVCKDFGDLEPVLREHNKKLYNELEKHLNNVNKKIKIIELPKFDSEEDKDIFKISRLLYIFKSYKKFIAYITADNYPDDKGIQYLYSLVAILYKKLLIVWEKTMDSTSIEPSINLLVPDYINDIISYYGLHNNTKIIMILKEKWKTNGIKGENNKDRIYEIMKDRDDIYFYEPLIIKKINSEEKKHMTLNEYPNIKKIINYNPDNKVFNNLKNINNLIEKVGSKNYKIDTIIINDNYTIDKIMLTNNILIRFNPQGIIILPYLIKELNIKEVVFLDDIVNKKHDVELVSPTIYSDFEKKINKLKDFGITFDIGVESYIDGKKQKNVLIIEKDNYFKGQVILFGKKNQYEEYNEKNTDTINKWLELRLHVKNKLLIALDAKDKRIDISKKMRAKFIENLLDMFDNNKKKIQIILEEIPIFTKEGINNWYTGTLLHTKYDYINNLSDNFIDNGNELLFTQFLIKKKIPKNILYYHEANPNIIYDKDDDNVNFDNIYDGNKNKIAHKSSSITKVSIKLPKMFNGEDKDLNAKWNKYKKKIWSKLKYIKNYYIAGNIIELFDYLKSLDNDIVNDYNDIIERTFKYYLDEFNKNVHNNKNIKIIKEIFEDPNFYSSYLNAMNSINKTKKTFKTLNIFLTTYFNNSLFSERQKILEYIKNSDEYIYHPNEITFRLMSEILNISILIIHNRTDYGKAVNIKKRADEKDLSITYTVFKAYNDELNRPLLMLYRMRYTDKIDKDKKYQNYYIVRNINHDNIIYNELNKLQENDDDKEKKINEIITIIQNTQSSKSNSLSSSSSTQTINI